MHERVQGLLSIHIFLSTERRSPQFKAVLCVMSAQRTSTFPLPLLLLLTVSALLIGGCSATDDSGAQQIHLALTDDPETIQVTYSTIKPVTASAKYGRHKPDTLVRSASGKHS